jgi:hypothetical protein
MPVGENGVHAGGDAGSAGMRSHAIPAQVFSGSVTVLRCETCHARPMAGALRKK